MVVISCELLGTASTYPKHHGYNFSNDPNALFHVPAVQLWSRPKNATKEKKLTKYA